MLAGAGPGNPVKKSSLPRELPLKPLGDDVKKGQGSFRVSNRAIDILIENQATAWQIGAYLTLARHTDETGKFSTASFSAIYRATGASPGTERQPGTGRRLVQALLKFNRPWHEPKNPKKTTVKSPQSLLYTAEEWTKRTGEVVPEIPHQLYNVGFVLNDFGGDSWTWLPNELIDGHGKFRQPLKRLKQCGDIAARLFLLICQRCNMEEFGGLPPYSNVCRRYEMTHLQTDRGFSFWKGGNKGHFAYNAFGRLVTLGKKPDPVNMEKETWKIFWNALEALENTGFIVEIAVVIDGDPDHPDARPLYTLQYRTRHGQVPKGEEGLAQRINGVFQLAGLPSATDAVGRFRESYAVISLPGIKPHVVGIYRPRFRVSNPKNYGVKQAWARNHQDNQEWSEYFSQLEEIFGSASTQNNGQDATKMVDSCI